MTHAVMRGFPTRAQLYLENIIVELVRETGREDDRHSLNRIIFKCFRDHPERLFLIDGKTDEKVTNGEILRRAVQVARSFDSHDLGPGDVAAAMAQNHVDFTALYFGALFAGVTLFNFETILTSYEVQHYVKLTKTTIVFADNEKVDLMIEALKEIPERPKFVVFGDKALKGELTFNNFIKMSSNDISNFWPVPMDNDSVPLLFTTGGSTGQGPPKVVPNTSEGLVAKLATEWTHDEEFPKNSELMLMMFHGQWLVHTMTFLSAAVFGAMILVQSENPNSDNMIDLVKKYKPTWIVIGPPDASDVILSPKYRHGDLHSIKKFFVVGVSPYQELLNKLKKELSPDARLSNRYGMTEAYGLVCLGDMYEPPALGPPLNVFLYKLVDKNGEVVKTNEPGELYLKSNYCIAKTYYGDEEAANNMFTPDGWFPTGDVLRQDENGVVYYEQRLKFTVFNKGYPFSPLEVEQVVYCVEGVAAVVVVGLDDIGPAALVVPRQGMKPSRDTIKEAVKAKLNYYKHLSGVGFTNALPRTVVGKVDRKKCAQIIKKMIANKECF